MEFADFIDGDDIGMIELGGRLRFSGESRPAIGILTKMKRKKLERDFAVELGVLGEIHLTHPTGPDLLDDPVMPDYGVFPKVDVRSGYVVLVII